MSSTSQEVQVASGSKTSEIAETWKQYFGGNLPENFRPESST
jgi:hypothetical protein